MMEEEIDGIPWGTKQRREKVGSERFAALSSCVGRALLSEPCCVLDSSLRRVSSFSLNYNTCHFVLLVPAAAEAFALTKYASGL